MPKLEEGSCKSCGFALFGPLRGQCPGCGNPINGKAKPHSEAEDVRRQHVRDVRRAHSDGSGRQQRPI